jgi:hypothetical protein
VLAYAMMPGRLVHVAVGSRSPGECPFLYISFICAPHYLARVLGSVTPGATPPATAMFQKHRFVGTRLAHASRTSGLQLCTKRA